MRVGWALLALGLVFGACRDEPTSARTVELPAGREGLPARPDQVVENGEHVITVDGVKKALVNAEQMYFFHDLGKVIGDTIQVTFYDANGIQQSVLTALTGELQQASQEMVARGNVHVRGETSWIQTEELAYDPVRNLVTSETTTEIHQEGNVIRGQGVESDPGLTDLKIRGASAVIRSESAFEGPSGRDTTAVEPAAVEQVPQPAPAEGPAVVPGDTAAPAGDGADPDEEPPGGEAAAGEGA